ncbi:hypothetical protein ACFXDJ_10265 [Streptomyces sp. NPDC059443]
MSENAEDIEQNPVDLSQDLAIEELNGEQGTTAVSTFSTIGCSSCNAS